MLIITTEYFDIIEYYVSTSKNALYFLSYNNRYV